MRQGRFALWKNNKITYVQERVHKHLDKLLSHIYGCTYNLENRGKKVLNITFRVWSFKKASGIIFSKDKVPFKYWYVVFFVYLFKLNKKGWKIQLTAVEKVYSSSVRALKLLFDNIVILWGKKPKKTAYCEKKESKEMQKLCNTISLRYWMFLLST